MKEEKTQGINTETATKDSCNTNKRIDERELLDLRAGYVQHTSPLRPNTAPFLNVLIDMKNNNKADSTINFTRKALMFLSKHINLSEPEAVKQFIAQMDRKNGYKHNLCVAYNHCLTFQKELRKRKRGLELGFCRSYFFKTNLDSTDSRCKKIVQ